MDEATPQPAEQPIPMWVVALVGRQQLELELFRDQLRQQPPPTAPTTTAG